MLPINKKISKFNFFNSNNIQYIVVHDVGTQSTAKNNVDYFSGGNRGASAHYFVDDTSIWQSVEDWHGAWHVGDGYNKYSINNQNSIGVEMCLPSGTVTAKTEQNTVELVKYLMSKYNVPASRVVRHYDASRKNCPRQFNLDGKWTRWNQFKAKLTAQTTAPKPPNNQKDWSKQYYTTNPQKVKLLKVDGLYGINDINFKNGKVTPNYPKGTPFVITGLKHMANGLPRLITQSGHLLSANKSIVQQVVASKPKKTNQQIANDIYYGTGGVDWGTGQTRVNKLRAAGYDSNVIQALVNKM